MKHLLQTVALMLLPLYAMAQSVGVGTTTPDASAKLEISATDAGLLIPRVSLTSTTDAATIPTPATSLMVFNTNGALPEGAGYYYNSGTTVSPLWVRLQDSPSSEGWLLTGNAGTDTATHFIGTTDAMDVSVRLNNVLTLKMRQNTALWTKSTNTMLGDNTGAALGAGLRNTFMGYYAGNALASGNNNTFVGYYAGMNTTANANVFIGHRAGHSNVGGGQNVLIGDYAGAGDTTGTRNILIGAGAGDVGDDGGSDNIQIGGWAGRLSSGTGNILIGLNAGYNNDTSYLTAIGYHSGRFNTSGFGNLNLGAFSGYNTSTGSHNHFIGYEAGYANTSGSRNIAMGLAARRSNSTGTDNIAIGDSSFFANNSLYNVSVGNRTGLNNTNGGNTVVGHHAFVANTTGSNNTVVGREAMEYDTLGAGNVAMGWRAMRNHREGVDNVAVGTGALEFSGENSYNVAVGRSAMFYNERSQQNVAVGFNTLANMTYDPGSTYTGANTAIGTSALHFLNPTTLNEGRYNTAIGYGSMTSTVTGYGNTSVGVLSSWTTNGNNNSVLGREAFQFDTSGSGNVAIGWRSLRNHQTGNDNVAVGTGAMENSNENSSNVAIGRSAMFDNTRSNLNVAIGFNALSDMTYDPGSPFTGANTAVGSLSMWHNNPTSAGEGVFNSAYGYSSMRDNLTGSYNVALGTYAMLSAQSPLGNTAIGIYAAQFNEGYHNVAIGREAFRFDSTGTDNVAIGYRAMNQHHNGRENVAVGTGAMENSGNAAFSVAVGRSALRFNADTLNVGIGFAAGHNSSGNGNVYIGPHAGYSATGDNELFIDNSTTANPLIYGDFAANRVGLSTNTPGGFLEIYNNSSIGTPHLLLQENNNDFARLGFSNANASRMWEIAGNISSVSYQNDDLNFYHPNVGDIMNISGTGRVGILTTGPTAILDVRGDAIFNENGGVYDFRIEGDTDPNLFFADASADRVGIGTAAPLDMFEVAGNFRLNHPSITVDYLMTFNGIDPALIPTNNSYGYLGTSANRIFHVHASTITYYTGLVNGSDRRIKENVQPVASGLDKVLKLKPVQYDIKSSFLANGDGDVRPEIERDRKNHIGFIAQDMKEVVPQVVSYDDETDLYGIKYVELVPILTKAIQEQQELIEAQTASMNSQQAEIDKLRREIELIKESLRR